MLLVKGKIPGDTRYSKEYVGIPHVFTDAVHASSAVFLKSLKVVKPTTPFVPMLQDTGRVVPAEIVVMSQELQASTVIVNYGVDVVIYTPSNKRVNVASITTVQTPTCSNYVGLQVMVPTGDYLFSNKVQRVGSRIVRPPVYFRLSVKLPHNAQARLQAI